MSRSGYSDDCENIWLYRRAVENSLAGRRGQAFLRELAVAMDAMPDKRLAADSLSTAEGEFCTLGVIGHARGIDLHKLEEQEPDVVGDAFGISRAMAAEIVYMNDEAEHDAAPIRLIEICGPMEPWNYHERYARIPEADPEQHRWKRMRAWVAEQIKEAA
jgi:hypothetical protein